MRRRTSILTVLFMLASLLVIGTAATGPAGAQWSPEQIETATATPVRGHPVEELAAPLDAERLEELAAAQAGTHLTGPIVEASAAVPTAPLPASSAATLAVTPDAGERAATPRAAGDFQIFRTRTINPGNILGNFRSNVAEVSQDQVGAFVFATGNWWAARSSNGGIAWTALDPFTGPFPAHSPFCCDQLINYDPARNVWLWERMGVGGTDPGGNFENVFVISVGSDAFASTSCHYVIEPTDTNAGWTDQWWDYSHTQLTEDFYYMSWNMFDEFDVWTRSVMLQIPLDELASCSVINYSYIQNTGWFTFVPVSGSDSRMYFASNWPSTPPQNSKIRVWRWDEINGGVSALTRNLTPWTLTGKGSAVCGLPAKNWGARTDQRLLTGTRFEYQDQVHRGRDVVAWWWNVAQGGGFPEAYIDAAAFYVDDMSQVPGNQGRPLVWNSSQCILYPSAVANTRGDHALIFHYEAGSFDFPYIGATIADDIVPDPPGYTFYQVRRSTRNPSDSVWGDYNTLRVSNPSGLVWTGGAHIIGPDGTCCSSTDPRYFTFGRERDRPAWDRFKNR